MKKILSLLICVLLISSVLFGCSAGVEEKTKSSYDLNIVSTVFPLYDWTENIIRGAAGVKNDVLVKNGTDVHSFQPSVEDVMKISDCDVFIFVGGESDKWVKDAIKNADNVKMVTVDLMQILGSAAKVEETVEGMQEKLVKEEKENDEHVWLSLKNAELFVKSISSALEKADPENAALYRENANSYNNKLTELDSEYSSVVKNSRVKTLLFGDRFPFRYLTDDYGLKYYAAFSGCSAESEASFNTITFLSDKVDELHLKYVMVIENGNEKIAQTIIESSKTKDVKILVLNSMQSVTQKEINSGVTYLSIMQSNLKVLQKALS